MSWTLEATLSNLSQYVLLLSLKAHSTDTRAAALDKICTVVPLDGSPSVDPPGASIWKLAREQVVEASGNDHDRYIPPIDRSAARQAWSEILLMQSKQCSKLFTHDQVLTNAIGHCCSRMFFFHDDLVKFIQQA